MPENAPDLRSSLVDLHRQLETTRSVDPEMRALLAELLTDIDRLLESGKEGQTGRGKGATAPESADSIAERLGDAAREFEETHPTLAGTIGSVIDALAQMGI
jgi:uncharacterized protein DUF4404